MAKVGVKKVLVPENDMDYLEIESFETENYVGLWNVTENCFTVLKKVDDGINLKSIHDYESFQDLDNIVYKLTNEHITYVCDNAKYKLTLI